MGKAGHRDTHFRLPEEIVEGDPIRLEGRDGLWRDFHVIATRIVDARLVRIDVNAERPRLILSTCYPFDAIVPGGPLRYLVFADATN